MAVWICWNFTNPSAATSPSVAVNITIIRFAICALHFLAERRLPETAAAPPIASLTDIEQDAAVYAVPVSCFLAEERRSVVLGLNGDEAVIAAQAPAARVPVQTTAKVAGQECLAVVDGERRPIEERQAAHAAGHVRND